MPNFEKENHIYGPLRLSITKNAVAYDRIVFPSLKYCIQEGCDAVFMVRDPRDILISQYYHHKYNQNTSPNKNIAKAQFQKRNEAKNMALDEYVLAKASNMRQYFRKAIIYREKIYGAITLKYEDMIDDFDQFKELLIKKIPLGNNVLDDLYLQSRPRQTEDFSSHHRSGKTLQYLEKLQPKTQDCLQTTFFEILRALRY